MSAEDGAAPLAALGQDAVSELMGEDPLAAAVVGIGIDVVDVGRFRRMLDRRAHLADRLFTDGEQVYARAAGDAVPRMSTRFAAKEATMKALGVGLGAFRFADVEVVRSGLDAPGLVLHGAAQALARRAGVVRWHLSLSHTDEVAMAIVVAVGDATAGRAAVPGRDAVPSARP
ncbi:MAG TPA: holo-ACP synthase [Acidimicrobiales bacterium]|nr:holo-ACP synthase [Acidimicrobiales bacterium]